jgi:hypothetical protein
MSNKYIIFVPGKNPKPLAESHRDLLWQALIAGLARIDEKAYKDLVNNKKNFKLIAWNYIFYHKNKNIDNDVLAVTELIKKTGPSEQDISESSTWYYKFDQIFYRVIDFFPWTVLLLTGKIRATVKEIQRYFYNKNNIACEVRELLKQELRPMLRNKDSVLLIGHSMGSIIAYDALWELSHLEKLPGKVDFLTIGSPLGMNYVQHNLIGNKYSVKKRYPTNIEQWINISADGDITALDNVFADDFDEMLKLGLVKNISDYCNGVYNYFRDKKGLNCHRSYGYLINSIVSKTIVSWWKK